MTRIEKDLLNYNSKYEKNGVLINKLGIEDVELLDKAERMITSYKLAKLYLEPGIQTFDPEHYLSIHKFLFDDIYEFAGKTRNENISKTIMFCPANFTYQELNRVLTEAKGKINNIDSREKLLPFITELYSDLDVIHPFREGNGRTEREFLRQFIDHICMINNLESYYLDYSAIENREEYIRAVIDADLCNYGNLLLIFDSILKVKTDEKELNNDSEITK